MLTKICKLYQPGQPAVYATLTDDDWIVPFYGLTHTSYQTLADLQTAALLNGETLAEHVGYLVARTPASSRLPLAGLAPAPDPSKPYLLPPLDNHEVWAAGVTYQRSRTARMEESSEASIYDRVYEAERPEIFFKTNPHRVSGPGGPIRVRRDSAWNVPEPELALVLDSSLRLVGYTICNDMSSREIEGANPLYLPQAKIYSGCCALGPYILLADPEEENPEFKINCRIYRGSKQVYEGETSTARMKRSFEDLIHWLGKENQYPDGVILSTGTGIVPPNEFTLKIGDRVEIEVENIGVLVNPVVE